jgi:hypothetical protein
MQTGSRQDYRLFDIERILAIVAFVLDKILRRFYMSLEQIPGNLDLKMVKGDDFICQFNVPYNASGYTFTTNVYETNDGIHVIPTSMAVQTSVLSIVQASFYASITSLFDSVSGTARHNWEMKYIDDVGLIRSFISGRLEVI